MRPCILTDVASEKSEVSHRPARPARKREHTRARLLGAAWQVLAAQGYAAASIDEICARAGFTRGAFYSNFATKDELVVAVFDEYATHRRDRLELVARDGTGAVPGDTDLAERLAAELLELTTEDQAVAKVILECRMRASENPLLASRLDAHDQAAATAFADLLTRVLPRGSVLAGLDPQQLATFLLALRAGVLTRVMSGGPAADQARAAFTSVLRALIAG